MKRFWFHPTLLAAIIVLVFGWTLFTSSLTVVMAQELTATPTPTVIQPSGMYITVNSDTEDHVNVRMGPSSAVYPIVGQIPRGGTAPALGRSPGGDWIQIEFSGAPNNKGWVYSPLVIISPGSLQVVEPPPTPVPPATATIDPTLAAQFEIIPTSTRLPTFTPPPAQTIPVFTDLPSSQSKNPVPMGIIIVSLGLASIIGFLISVSLRQ